MARVRRKRYSDAFTLEAVRLVHTSDWPVTDIAEPLGVTSNTLHEWVRSSVRRPWPTARR